MFDEQIAQGGFNVFGDEITLLCSNKLSFRAVTIRINYRSGINTKIDASRAAVQLHVFFKSACLAELRKY